jgi:hypothetical protein
VSARVDRELESPRTAARPVARPAPAVGPEAVLALQRGAGNAAVARLLARQGATASPAAAATATPAHADWSSPANAQTTAAATRTRLLTQLLPFMTSHRDPIVRNTAELFTGPTPLLTMDAITKRPDSALQVAKPTNPAWVTANPHDAYFTGTTITNVHFMQPNMIGTILGSTMYVRGHDAAGDPQSLDELAGVVTHEVSHYFVSQYGELPATKNAISYDRYADEFRAYWVEYHGIASGLSGADKAKKIREHLVGTSGDPNSGYSNFHAAYFAAGTNAFKTAVDALAGPVGYNLTNSIRLHRLWLLFGQQASGAATVDDLVLAIDALPVAERQEAARASLLTSLIAKLPATDGKRIRRALDAPTVAEYTQQVNPSGSPAIAGLLKAIVAGHDDEIKQAYRVLGARDRNAVAMNAAFLAYLDFHLTDAAIQACVYAMVASHDAAQYDAMAAFVSSLRSAKDENDLFGISSAPSYVIDAMDKLTDESRWSFFSWARNGALKQYADVLPAKVANEIRERLRD